MTTLSRRDALKLISKLSCSLYLAPTLFSGCATSLSGISATPDHPLIDLSPIERGLPDLSAPRAYFGDQPHAAHRVLWNRDSFLANRGGAPSPTEERALVIVGAGISGLVTAFLLRDFDPLILDQAARFGGNSKGQSWRGIDYSIGAAYFCAPEEGSLFHSLLTDLSLQSSWKKKSEEDPVALNGSILTTFWQGDCLPSREGKQARAIATYLKLMLEGEEIAYPDIPILDPSMRESINVLDQTSLRSHLETKFGSLGLNISTLIEHFCWSSFGASAAEISAAAGLNFLAAEFGDIGVLPGGNAAIAEGLVARLSAELPAQSLRSSSMVLDVSVDDRGATVTYVDANDTLHSIRSKSVVLACPKFIVSKILRNIEPERVDAIKRIEYRSYLVANVLIGGPLDREFYDLYLLGNGSTAGLSPVNESDKRWATDVVFANYASSQRGHTVLTLYRSLPFTGGRALVLDDATYDQIRARFEQQLRSEILPLLKVTPERIIDLRIARWGHPLPVARVGLIADGVVDAIKAPFQERVFFIEQDNWALPAIETCLSEAESGAAEIRRFLARI